MLDTLFVVALFGGIAYLLHKQGNIFGYVKRVQNFIQNLKPLWLIVSIVSSCTHALAIAIHCINILCASRVSTSFRFQASCTTSSAAFQAWALINKAVLCCSTPLQGISLALRVSFMDQLVSWICRTPWPASRATDNDFEYRHCMRSFSNCKLHCFVQIGSQEVVPLGSGCVCGSLAVLFLLHHHGVDVQEEEPLVPPHSFLNR